MTNNKDYERGTWNCPRNLTHKEPVRGFNETECHILAQRALGCHICQEQKKGCGGPEFKPES